MSEKPISDLRRRLLQDMTNRRFGDKTKHDYIRHVEALARFLGRSPDTADDVRRFQARQIEAGGGYTTMTLAVGEFISWVSCPCLSKSPGSRSCLLGNYRPRTRQGRAR